MGKVGDDADAQGRDSTGLKARIPWVRWHSRSRSPSATKGWYVVYLFHADGSGVSLCLSHGSTKMEGGSFVKRSPTEVEGVMNWARSVVGTDFDSDPSVGSGISLGNFGLGEAYERTTLFSKFYRSDGIPEDDVLEADLVRFVRPLARLYEAADRGGEPGSPNPETRVLQDEVERYIAPLRAGARGQGRGLSGEERKAVEVAAMQKARAWLQQEGFIFRDVSSRDCCDFRAQRDGEDWVVEVKGTTGRAGSVLLTRNEVALHRASYPRNILLIVHSLSLSEDRTSAGGGDLVIHCPWRMDEDRLSAIGYEYRLD